MENVFALGYRNQNRPIFARLLSGIAAAGYSRADSRAHSGRVDSPLHRPRLRSPLLLHRPLASAASRRDLAGGWDLPRRSL